MRRNVTVPVLLLVVLAAVKAASPAPGAAQQPFTRDPAQVPLVVEDLHRLAGVLRSLEAGGDTLAVLQRDYLAVGSAGLREYAERFSLTEGTLREALRRNPAAYADLDALAASILSREAALRAAFAKLLELFPGAVFPPVWFVAGHMGAGGNASAVGALIAAERYAGDVDAVVPLALHELAHFQSGMVQGVETYSRVFGPERSLLALALREGTAELIAELTTGAHTNPAAAAYGQSREAELCRRFRSEMHRRDTGDWMYVRPSSGAPADLGYWIGYRVARAYYEGSHDRQRAIREMIALTDFAGFLEISGYCA
jgi:hypothetical protein